MQLLKDRIKKDGMVLSDTILKVDKFINQQVDPLLMKKIGIEFANRFRGKKVDAIMTIEAGGIAPAVFVALELNVPLVVIKKGKSKTANDVYTSTVKSFTKNKVYDIVINKSILDKHSNVLFIDDFLAEGNAFFATQKLLEQANVTIEGIGIIIEKSFQAGRAQIEELGYDIYSLARIREMSPETGIIWED